MNKPKLVYFDINGARGEAARLAMVIGEVPFEDDRVKFADWESRKSGTPFDALPVLEVDGQTVAQSNGINRFRAMPGRRRCATKQWTPSRKSPPRCGTLWACRKPKRRRSAKP